MPSSVLPGGVSCSQVLVLRPAEPDWPSEGWDTPESATPTPSADLSHLPRLPPSIQEGVAPPPPAPAPAPGSAAPGLAAAIPKPPDVLPAGPATGPGVAEAPDSPVDHPLQAGVALTPDVAPGEEAGSAQTLHTSGGFDSLPSVPSTAPPSDPAAPHPVLPPKPSGPSEGPTSPDPHGTEGNQGASLGDTAAAPDAGSAEAGAEANAAAGQAFSLSEAAQLQPDSLDSSATKPQAGTASDPKKDPGADDK